MCCLLASYGITTVLAQPSNSILCIDTTSGEHLEYLLNTNPRLTPNESKMVLTTNTITMEFQTNKIAKVYIVDPSTDVSETKKISGNFQLLRDYIYFSGYGGNESITMYSADGRQMMHQKTDGNGNLTLSLHGMANGTYIIKTKHQSIKIIKK